MSAKRPFLNAPPSKVLHMPGKVHEGIPRCGAVAGEWHYLRLTGQAARSFSACANCFWNDQGIAYFSTKPITTWIWSYDI